MKKLLSLIFLSLCLIACEKIEEITYIPFKATFEAPQVVRVGERIAFKADASTTGAQKFFWKFGDKKNQTSEDANPTFAYDTIGEYVATMVVDMNKKGGIKKDSAKQKIFALPTTFSSGSGLYEQFNYGDEFGVDEVAMDFAQTSDGGFIVVGQKSLNSIYITKLKPSLNPNDVNWVFGIDDFGASPIYPKDVIQTSDGGYLIVGYTDIGVSDSDAFILKLNAQGSEEWRNTETNSSNYERYTSVIESSNGVYVVVGSIGKSANTAVPILHKIDAFGDYVAKTEISNFKNFQTNQIIKNQTSTDYFITGMYIEQPVVINVGSNLIFKGITRLNFTGEAKGITFLTGGDIFTVGRGYTDGNVNLEDSTSYAFGARFDAINGNPQNWLSKAKMYRERYIEALEIDLDNIVCVGEHYNPNSGRDLLFTKINPQNGNIQRVRLLGDESDHRPAKAIFDGTYIYILATTREFISEKNSRYDICIVKTKLTDILP